MIKYILVGIIIFTFKGEKCDYISDYYQTVYQAEIHYLKNENEKALDLFKKVEAECGLLNRIGTYEPLIVAELYVRVKQENKAFPYLYRLLEDGLTFEMLNNNPEFDVLKSKKQWVQLKEDAPELESEFQKSINKELRNEIVKMKRADQNVRNGNFSVQERIAVDSINENRMKEIFIEFGYPHYKLIGYSTYLEDTNIQALLMHFKDTTFFKQKLMKSIRNGVASPSELAALIDSRQRSIGIFTYGAYQNVDSTKIKNFEKIDQTRTAIGLRPYKLEKEYWKLMRAKYDSTEY